jgi:hypothetical protein
MVVLAILPTGESASMMRGRKEEPAASMTSGGAGRSQAREEDEEREPGAAGDHGKRHGGRAGQGTRTFGD